MRSVAVVFAAMLLASVVAPAHAADHREAPIVNGLPQADINDIYAFRNPTDPSRLVLVMTVNPFSVPDVAGSYNFSPDVLYRFAIDNTGDARFDKAIDITFSPLVAGAQNFTARFPGGRKLTGPATRPTVLSGTPNEPVVTTGLGSANVKVFAGPRDDPFFFDAVGFNRVVAGVGGFTSEDAFAGVNVSAIVVEIPVFMVRQTAANSRLQIEGFTYRASQPANPKKKGEPVSLNTKRVTLDGRTYVQTDRMGNPAVATALIPGPLKDAFNQGLPYQDAANFAPAILASLAGFGTPDENVAILASVAVPDTLKLDLGQSDGFPNGRRLKDDTIDTLLKLILANPAATDGANANDRPLENDFPFLGEPQQVP